MKREGQKRFFLHSSLFHSKSTVDFMGISDVDGIMYFSFNVESVCVKKINTRAQHCRVLTTKLLNMKVTFNGHLGLVSLLLLQIGMLMCICDVSKQH